MGDLYDENVGVKVGVNRYRIKPVSRLLSLGDVEKEWKITYFYGDFSDGHDADGVKIFNVEQLLLRDGGLILGEGDAGKSVFVRMLAEAAKGKGPVKIVRLRDNSGGRISLSREYEALLSENENPTTRATLIIDGLDENQIYGRDILDLVAQQDVFEKGRIWVTSRPCKAASALESGDFSEGVYRLLPMSHSDIRDIVKQIDGVDPEAFFKTVEESKLGSFLRKPGGVIMLLKFYANGDLSPQVDKRRLMADIAKDFVRATRDGVADSAYDCEYSDADLVEVAGWIATCLFFAGKDSIWMGRPADAPNVSLKRDEIPNGKYKPELIDAVLKRRIFEPLESDRLRITYADMATYLTGCWIGKNLKVDGVANLFAMVGAVSPELGEVAKWASEIEPRIAFPLVSKRPEAFFSNRETLIQYGVKRYFNDLLGKVNAERLPMYNEESWFEHNDDLEGFEELEEEARDRIAVDDATDEQRILSAWLLGSCRVDREKSASVIVNLLRSGKLSPGAVEHVANELVDLCGDERYACLGNLKVLLGGNPKTSWEEALLGCIIWLLWPNWMTAKDVVRHLVQPVSQTHTRYADLFAFDRGRKIAQTIDKESMLTFLTWAQAYFHPVKEGDYLHEIAMYFFEIGWRWSSDSGIAHALAMMILNYVQKAGNYDFLPKKDAWPCYYRAGFRDFKVGPFPAGRMNVLVEIAKDMRTSQESILGFAAGNERSRLITDADFEEGFLRWKQLYGHKSTRLVARKFASILSAVVRVPHTDNGMNALLELHTAYPEEHHFDIKWLKVHRREKISNETKKAKRHGGMCKPESEQEICHGLKEEEVLARLTPDLLRKWGERTNDAFVAKVLDRSDVTVYVGELIALQRKTGRAFPALRKYFKKIMPTPEKMAEQSNDMINFAMDVLPMLFFGLMVRLCKSNPKRVSKWFEECVKKNLFNGMDGLLAEVAVDDVAEFYVWAGQTYFPRRAREYKHGRTDVVGNIQILLWNSMAHRLVQEPTENVLSKLRDAASACDKEDFNDILERVERQYHEKYDGVKMSLETLNDLCADRK